MEEHVPVPMRVYIIRESSEMPQGGRRDKHTRKNCRRRIEEELRGTVKVEAAQSSRKAREGISGQSSREGNETNEVEPGGRTDGCVNNNDSNNNEFEPQQRGTGTKFKKQSNAARKGSSGEGNGSSSVDNKRKADGEHLEHPETEDGKWMIMTLHLGAYGMRGCMGEFVSEQDGACLRRTFSRGASPSAQESSWTRSAVTTSASWRSLKWCGQTLARCP